MVRVYSVINMLQNCPFMSFRMSHVSSASFVTDKNELKSNCRDTFQLDLCLVDCLYEKFYQKIATVSPAVCPLPL